VIKDYKEVIPLKKIKIPFSSQIGCTFGNVIKLSDKFQLRLNKMMFWQNKLLPGEFSIKEATTWVDCDQPKNELIVMYNGDVAGCGNDFECKINLGNLQNSTINEMAATKKYIDFKTNIKKNVLMMPICKICQGTIIRKDTGQAIHFKLPTLKKYFYLFLDDPRKCIKKIKTKIKAKMKK
jgi:radical SAM protein with 4Fe4S-binding SPASM domain